MNPDNDNLNQGNLNTQGGNGAFNDQPLNNQSFNQNTDVNQRPQSQAISNLAQPTMQEPIQQPINQAMNDTINNQNNYDTSQKKKETLGTVSLILGIISLALSLFLNILILPIAITGLIFGIINKTKKGKKIAGIILNSVAIFIVLILLAFAIWMFESADFKDFFSTLYNELDYSTSENYIAGKYDCTGVDSNTDKYLVTLHLNEDNTFLFGPYGDLENNYGKGTYTYEDENKTNGSGEYKYFMVTFKGEKEDFIVDGKQSDHGFNSQMEFGVTSKNAKKEGIIVFTHNYNMYYCYEN